MRTVNYKNFQKMKIKQRWSNGLYLHNLTQLKKSAYTLYSKECGYLTVDQIESMRRVLVRGTGRQAYIWFPKLRFYPLVFLGKNARMGKGKGKVKKEFFFTKVTRGQVICHISNLVLIDKTQYKNEKVLILKALKKLPLICSFFCKSL